MKHHTNIFIYVTFTFLFSSLAYFAYLVFYTPPYFDAIQPFALEKKEYRIGENLVYTSHYCKHREYIPVKIERSLVNKFVYPLPNTSTSGTSLGNFPVGCREIQVEVPLLLPLRVPTGKEHKYHIEIVIEYKINPLQNQIRTFKTEEFTLLP